MRAPIVIALASLAIPIAFLSPFLGLLAYCWLSYMRPQDMTYGIGHITFGLYVAVALFAGLLFKLRFQFFRWHPVTWVFLGVWSWWAWCTFHAFDRDAAMEGLIQISRIFLICLVTTGICTTQNRLKWVMVAIAGSLLFHGTKLGVTGFLTGGSKQLNPIGGLMSGNNENAIALTIAIPFAVHFALNETVKWRRIAYWSMAGLTTIAVILTYSRGGFLGLAASAGVLVWNSRARWVSLFVGVPVLATAFFLFAPSDYTDRIGGISSASKSDMSAQLRIQAWGVAATITAQHPFEGIGPKNFYGQSHRFPRPYTMPDMEIHNTWLELSSSLGITGLLAYLTLIASSMYTAHSVRRDARLSGDPRLHWFVTGGTAVQAAITGFLVSSTFGSLAHFDLIYHMCALGVCLPTAYRHERDRLRALDAGEVLGSADAPPPQGSSPVWAGLPAASLPLSRYDERPAIAGAPQGLPDFRNPAPAAPVFAAPETPPAATSVPAVPSPAAARETAPRRQVWCDTRSGAGEDSRSAESATGCEDDPVSAEPAAASRPRPAPEAAPAESPRAETPHRHTAPLGSRDDVRVDASTMDLEGLFIDPYGTIAPTEEDFLADATCEGPEPQAPRRRSMSASGRPLEEEAAPYLTQLERRALTRPKADPAPDRGDRGAPRR